MKTTVELSDTLFRRAKMEAVGRGITFKKLLTDALQRELSRPLTPAKGVAPGTAAALPGFGELRHLRKETQRIQRLIKEEFRKLEPEDLL